MQNLFVVMSKILGIIGGGQLGMMLTEAAQNMKNECEADLAEAMPILQKAIKALNTLSKNDITEVKSMKTPPAGVLITMEAVCLMMSVKPARSRDDKGKVQYDYWEPAKKDLLKFYS